ncbi:MAG: response regulator transcription factor [Dehalococcoidia bacterium]|nr:response regulator transcription factor [Dehalococcoidia bacterium]
MRAKILLVDDDELLRASLRYQLEREGYHVMAAQTGAEGLEKARLALPDLVLLDIGLPDMDGREVCRILQQGTALPVIFLTARGDEIDRVSGLRLGADDYMVKPFSMAELIARIDTVLRRSRGRAPADTPSRIEAGDITLNVDARRALVRGRDVEMAPKEFDLLRILAAHPGRALKREFLLDAVWGQDFFGDTKTLDVHIRRLREKVETHPERPQRIVTVRGVGYMFVAAEPSHA